MWEREKEKLATLVAEVESSISLSDEMRIINTNAIDTPLQSK